MLQHFLFESFKMKSFVSHCVIVEPIVVVVCNVIIFQV
jgi:hypothetical protein